MSLGYIYTMLIIEELYDKAKRDNDKKMLLKTEKSTEEKESHSGYQ